MDDDCKPRPFSIKLWPPSDSTRELLVNRITNNLQRETTFSRKYGMLSKEEAEYNAKRIEEDCFILADDHFKNEPDGDGSSAVQLYAKETSKRMVEVLRKGPGPKEKTDEPVVHKPVGPAGHVFDISGGRRAFIDAEEARELLSPLAEPGNSYTKICFSNRSFGIDAANVAAPILASIKSQLKEVDLSDFVAGRSEEDALEVMKIFSLALEGSSLRYLNLSDNALGEKGVRAFEALLRSQNSLVELYLNNDGISEDAAKAVSELIPSTENLKILHFYNNMTGDEGAVAIAEVLKRSPALEDFRCSATRVDSEGGVALAQALETCTNLKRLDLKDNLFGVEAAKTLSKTILKISGITEINLSYLNLEDEGAIAIANALKESAPCMEILELAGNEITAEAAPALAECLSAMQSLKKVSLAENELKDNGATIIGKALEEGHSDLKELDFSINMLRRVGARSLAQAVSNKPGFVLLNINGNYISDEGIDEVKDVLKAGENSIGVLGPLDENDPEGEGEEEEEGEDEDADGLESKLQNLKVEQD